MVENTSSIFNSVVGYYIYDSNGNYLGRERWTAPNDGTFYVGVTFHVSRDYVLQRIDFDDHGNEPVTATPIATPFSGSGRFKERHDVDVFSFYASGESVFEISAISDRLIYLRVTNAENEDTGRILRDTDDGFTWLAPLTGTYYLAAENRDRRVNLDYSLTVEQSPDDHGDDLSGATLLFSRQIRSAQSKRQSMSICFRLQL